MLLTIRLWIRWWPWEKLRSIRLDVSIGTLGWFISNVKGARIFSDILSFFQSSMSDIIRHIWVREAPFNKVPPLFGHCPNSNYTPPRTQTGTLGHFYQAWFYHFFYHFLLFLPFFTIFSLNKCPKPSGQGFRPPQNQANAPLNLENSSLKKCKGLGGGMGV